MTEFGYDDDICPGCGASMQGTHHELCGMVPRLVLETIERRWVSLFTCPRCRNRGSGYTNIGRDQWFFCVFCHAAWLAGSNLFSSWMEETEEDWNRNRQFLSQFEVIEAT